MKKNIATVIICTIILVAIVIMGNVTPINGYYDSVEQLREFEKELYDSATLIHTYVLLDKHVDFIIDKDDNYCVIEIDKKQTPFGEKYVKGTWSSRSMTDAVSEDVQMYEQSGILDFTSLPHFGRKSKSRLFHCFAPHNATVLDTDVRTIAFSHNDSQFLLCLKISAQ